MYLPVSGSQLRRPEIKSGGLVTFILLPVGSLGSNKRYVVTVVSIRGTLSSLFFLG